MTIQTRFRLSIILFILCSACFAGCSGEDSPQANQDADEIIPELPEAAVDVQPVAHRSVASPEVSLQPGARYYFVKSIEQKLGIEPGNPIGRVWERVEFLFSLTVREEAPNGYILDVAFHNVQYQCERGEHHLQYDSRSQAPVPPEVLPYRGMIDRGFSLHLDRHNRIVDVVGFDEFIAQCFAEYPAKLQQKLMLSMGALSEAPSDRINSAIVFLDESFALLPFREPGEDGKAFTVGTHWNRTLTRTQPVPVAQNIEATLQNIFGDGQWAQVVINGQLKPARPMAAADTTAEIQNHVTGGTITGSCSVSLTTGLPTTCRIQREILFEISANNRPSVPVRKTIVTTLDFRSVEPVEASPSARPGKSF